MVDDDGKTSFQILCDVLIKNDHRLKDISFDRDAALTQKFWKKEARFFEKKWTNEKLCDSDLVAQLENIQSKIFSEAKSDQLIDDFFQATEISNNIGINFTVAQLLSELYGSNYGTELLILKDNREYEEFNEMVSALLKGELDVNARKKLNRFIVERQITVANKNIIIEMGLQELGILEIPNLIRCYQVSSNFF